VIEANPTASVGRIGRATGKSVSPPPDFNAIAMSAPRTAESPIVMPHRYRKALLAFEVQGYHQRYEHLIQGETRLSLTIGHRPSSQPAVSACCCGPGYRNSRCFIDVPGKLTCIPIGQPDAPVRCGLAHFVRVRGSVDAIALGGNRYPNPADGVVRTWRSSSFSCASTF
jgi:hypothetical protein